MHGATIKIISTPNSCWSSSGGFTPSASALCCRSFTKLQERGSLQNSVGTQERDYSDVMCSRVDVVEKFAAFIIVIDEMMEAEGLAETWVNFCLIRGVTSQKRVWCSVHNFLFFKTIYSYTRWDTRKFTVCLPSVYCSLLYAYLQFTVVYCMPNFSLL